MKVESLEVEDYGNPLKQCGSVQCRAGRECRVLSTGMAVCICQRKCPDRRHPVCGSDGVAYENHCELHREACIQGIHIYPLYGNQSCHEDPLAKLKRELEKAKQEIHEYERNKIKVPRACHQNDRDRTREFLISWIKITSRKQPWFDKKLDYKNLLACQFDAMDAIHEKNGFVDSDEWLHYFLEYRNNKSSVRNEISSNFSPATTGHSEHLQLQNSLHHNHHISRKNKFLHHTHKSHKSRRKDKQNDRMRKLCIEALVEEGDRDKDWRLTISEFINLMDPEYQPSSKYCIRDRKHYEDGTRIKVDCNGCTCACGKWICTSKLCGSYNQDNPSSSYESKNEEEKQYEDMDNQID